MANAEALCWLPIDALATLYRREELSPVEITRTLLERVGRLDGQLNCFVALLEASSLREAEESERRHRTGSVLGPMDGIPVALKDHFHVAGFPTTAGSLTLAGSVATADSAVVERLRAAGAILLGKNHMTEFGHGPQTGINPHFGATRNPWNLKHMVGGSSSGSAAAVAAGLVFGSVGSEAGASVRRPAAFCGVVGFKPTYGRISCFGAPFGAPSLGSIGVFARTVAGAATLADTLTAHDPRDPFCSRREAPPSLIERAKGVSGLRLGVLRAFLTEDLDDEARRAFEEALDAFRQLGAKVEDLEAPSVRFSAITSTLIKAAEFASYHREGLRHRPKDYSAELRGKLYQGAAISAGEYLLLQRARRLIAAEVNAAFSLVDLLVAPTMPGSAPRIEEGYDGLKEWPLDAGTHQTNLVRLPSLLGLPTISIPCGWNRHELPLGLELTGRPYAEPTVIRAACAYEEVTRYFERHPGLG